MDQPPRPPSSRSGVGELEKRIQNEIIETLGVRTDLRIWRANTGVARPLSDLRAVVRFGVSGQADISGILAGGRRLEIEVKSPTGRQSEAQRNFQAMIERFGGLYIVARSAAEAVEAIERAKGVAKNANPVPSKR